MILQKVIPAVLLLFVSTVATAEIGGLLNGRSADLNKLPDSSIELGIDFGEFGGADYRYVGARYNHRINPDLMAFADAGSMEISIPSFTIFGQSVGGDVDGFSFGVGAFYMLQDMLDTADTAVKASFHMAGGDIDFNILSLEGIVSGRNGIGSNPDLQWYANGGINSVDSETEFLLGFGLVLPMQSGQLFGGVDLIDDIHFGIGYRHFM